MLILYLNDANSNSNGNSKSNNNSNTHSNSNSDSNLQHESRCPRDILDFILAFRGLQQVSDSTKEKDGEEGVAGGEGTCRLCAQFLVLARVIRDVQAHVRWGLTKFIVCLDANFSVFNCNLKLN